MDLSQVSALCGHCTWFSLIIFIPAAQMWELVNLLPFVIGRDMPPNDPHYECFMLLSYISSILFSTVIARDQIPLLRLLIKEYSEQFATFIHIDL